ncbi:MAG TPA: ABC transporter ATP-binding protein, partial [Clostridia bacterium]|nr:ABC transporter ATP-binding protein [Clostridia bacterium]
MKSLRNVLYLLGLIWSIRPSRVLWQVGTRCLSLSYGAFYTLVLFRTFLNALQDNLPFHKVVIFLAFFSLYGLATALVKSVFENRIAPETDQVVLESLTRRAYEKAMAADLARYDDPSHHDRYARALEQIQKKCLDTLDLAAQLISQAFALVLNAGFALWIAPDLLAFSILPMILVFHFTDRQARRIALRDQEAVPAQRRMDYLGRVAYLQQYAKELRLTSIASILRRQFRQAAVSLDQNARRHGRIAARWRAAADCTNLAGLYVGLYLFAVWRFLRHSAFALGDFASISGAILNIVYFVEDIGQNYAKLREHSLYAQHLRDFWADAPTLRSGTEIPRFDKSIEFRDVGFAYEGSENFVLRHLNLSFRPGERLALVGANGAGKTTLVKLLLRLYDPVEGEILLDGLPYARYDLPALRALFATAFQDFQIYAATAAENV